MQSRARPAAFLFCFSSDGLNTVSCHPGETQPCRERPPSLFNRSIFRYIFFSVSVSPAAPSSVRTDWLRASYLPMNPSF